MWITIIICFLVSYFLGIMMRLIGPDRVDEKSGQYRKNKLQLEPIRDNSKSKLSFIVAEKRWHWAKFAFDNRIYHWLFGKQDIVDKTETEIFLIKKKIILGSTKPGEKEKIDKANFNNKLFYKWLFATENFPYPIWQAIKVELYHPKEVIDVFNRFKPIMLKKGKDDDETDFYLKSKIFFNYCKLLIYSRKDIMGDILIEEIYHAEALVRLCAGLYYGLYISFFTTGLLLFFKL